MGTEVQPQAQAGGLRKIGDVAAENIVQRLKLDAATVSTVERAISDEINAMSAHFTITFADLQTQYEAEAKRLESDYVKSVAAIKSEFTFLAANKLKVGIAALITLLIGVGLGLLI